MTGHKIRFKNNLNKAFLIKIRTLICVFGTLGQNPPPTDITKLTEVIFSAFTENLETHAHMPLFKSCH